MTKTLLVTTVKVGVTDPNNSGLEVTGFDENGDPIFRKNTLTIPSNVLYEFDSAFHDIDELRRIGCVREPTATEAALGRADPPAISAHREAVGQGRGAQ